MKALLLFTIFFFNLQAKEIMTPIGDFSCRISYFEHYAISIEEGEDFPTFGGHYDSPIKREENLIITFGNNVQGPTAYIQNPEVLPNWILVTPPYYEAQTSWSQVSEEEIFYQVNWNGTWYFGSGIDIITQPFDGKTLKVDLHFNDYDSTGELHRGVKCHLI